MIYYNLKSRPELIQNHLDKLTPFVEQRIETSSLNRPLKDFIEDNLTSILIEEPDKLIKLNRKFRIHKSYKPSLKPKIRKIFNYTQFAAKSNVDGVYDGYELAKLFGVRTCLYCNRMYTLTVTKGHRSTEKITRPQFDHFIDKGENPLLALSIYNLIPSCNICNSTLKGRKKFTLKKYIHPFVDNFHDEYSYRYIPHDISSILGGKSNLEAELHINDELSTTGKKIKNSRDTFKLNQIMSAHSDELKDLFDIRYRFSERYFLELFNTYKSLGLDRKEIYRIVFGVEYDPKDFVNRPFSKLKKDILKELNII